MNGRGQPPDEEFERTPREVDIGETLYTEGGEAIGTVRGVEENGLVISTDDGFEQLSIEHVRTAHRFAEAELMWRCMNCGEMGEIASGVPEDCPDCGFPREQLMYWTED